ncbi:MAG: hypothetical protein C4532_16080 [Candidatus Abyssobacteria bacterium SURF_17]|uniref:Porin n=1 Tax=Candidatus Abyssobacteria bacterium SURF_17 TaxID=2093361 RepID=A0A419ESE1_9BACT|nr:MAG: hypothetical protein C4532_16080 [Candidatus Abyssubacteria bacterium SURF_17]
MKKWILCVCIGALLLPGTVFAQQADQSAELESLRRTVEEQNRTISELLRRLEALEATQEEQVERVEAEKSEEKKPVWTDNVKVKGGLRYRYEYIDDERKDDDRNRNRIKATIGLAAKVNEDVDLGFELSTGEVVDANGKDEGDPVSNNQTLTNAWSGKNIWVSQAYADWHPSQVPGLDILLGKMHRPFISPVSSELIWDSDVNPEGAALKYKKAFDSTELMANAYGFYVVERSEEGDSGLFGLQGALKHNFTAFDDKAHLMGGLSYYDYGNVEGEKFFVEDKSFGNTADATGDAFAEDFDLFELFGEFGWRVKSVPVAVFADYVNNVAADDEDTGWSVGFKVGKASDPGSWEFRYLYKEVEQDAVFGTFTDSDFGGGGTDTDGHEINLVYQLAKNWQLGATFFFNNVQVEKEPEEDFTRIQLDTIWKF